jgi:hypothetical protein
VLALKKVVAAGILLCLQSFRPRRASRDGHCRYPRQCVYLVPSVGCWAAHGAALWGSTCILVLVTSSKIFYGYLLEIVPFLAFLIWFHPVINMPSSTPRASQVAGLIPALGVACCCITSEPRTSTGIDCAVLYGLHLPAGCTKKTGKRLHRQLAITD